MIDSHALKGTFSLPCVWDNKTVAIELMDCKKYDRVQVASYCTVLNNYVFLEFQIR